LDDTAAIHGTRTSGRLTTPRSHALPARAAIHKQAAGRRKNLYLDEALTTWSWTENSGAGPVKPVVDGSSSANFLDFVRARAYSNVASRMLGEDLHAYHPKSEDNASLDRAVSMLRRIPFGLIEEPGASFMLLAHAFSRSEES
jgi:hypothetical protein